MPLPRFERLGPDDRAAVLAVARAHFARHGHGASFNRIVAEAGISKTTAYHYFDGKDDLLATVVADAAGRAVAAVGDWVEAPDADALWAQVADTVAGLAAHLRERPDDRAVLALADGAGAAPWTDALVDDAARLGLVAPVPGAPDGGADALRAATRAVVGALDTWALETDALGTGAPGAVPTVVVELLRRLWGAPLT